MYVKALKKSSFEKLATNDQKQFWKLKQVLTHRKFTKRALTLGSEVDCDKARALNTHFSKMFQH